MKGADGVPTSRGDEISMILHSFYTELYSRTQSNSTAKSEFWKNIVLPQMTSEQVSSLITPITAEEVRSAIKQLQNNKAPGPDGLSNDFYKILGPKLEETLVKVFNSLLDGQGQDLPLYFNSALMKVLHKPGRDPEQPALYRPISLLNSDYKIYTKIIQSGFIPGRHSMTNVCKVLTVMQ